MNRVNLKIGVTIAALSALLLSTASLASAAKPMGKNGVIYACFKAKGKNKGALRVVARKRACRKMRGWRSLSWGAKRPSKQGARVRRGRQGPPGNSGPEGKAGEPGSTGEIEKSLLETIQTQTAQINALSAQVADLSGDLADLEGTVADACGQLSVLTDQTDEVLASLLGASIGGVLGAVLDVPSPPEPLGAFECT